MGEEVTPSSFQPTEQLPAATASPLQGMLQLSPTSPARRAAYLQREEWETVTKEAAPHKR